MYLKIVKVTLLLILISGFNLSTLAIEPEEFCDRHNEAAQEDPALGSCDVCGPRCVVLTDSQLGNKIYKRCPADGTNCLQTQECKEDCSECGCEE